MPKKVTAYACEFGCGRLGKTKACIEKHEKTCFLNPARRSCKTCKYESFEEGAGRDCSNPDQLWTIKYSYNWTHYGIEFECAHYSQREVMPME
jgi:hypothetical protein